MGTSGVLPRVTAEVTAGAPRAEGAQDRHPAERARTLPCALRPRAAPVSELRLAPGLPPARPG